MRGGETAAFSCRNCGAPTDWLPNGLTCSSCGRVEVVEPLANEVARRPLRPVFAGGAEWTPAESDEHQLRCPNCGGAATYGGAFRSTVCPFCAGPVALKDVHDASGRLPVDGVIPFQIDDGEAHRAVRRWLARAYFAPRGSRLQTKATHYARLYIPVLSIDAEMVVDYESRGHWRSDWGQVTGAVHDVVVPASNAVDQQYLDRFRPWPLHLALPYRPEYLAGTYCESYDRDLATIRELIHEALRGRGKEMAKAALKADTPWGNDTPALDSWTCSSYLETYRHLLFPVYLVTTRHEERVRQVVVNGINGDVAAQTPISPWKIGIPLAALATVALVLPWVKDAFG